MSQLNAFSYPDIIFPALLYRFSRSEFCPSRRLHFLSTGVVHGDAYSEFFGGMLLPPCLLSRTLPPTPALGVAFQNLVCFYHFLCSDSTKHPERIFSRFSATVLGTVIKSGYFLDFPQSHRQRTHAAMIRSQSASCVAAYRTHICISIL